MQKMTVEEKEIGIPPEAMAMMIGIMIGYDLTRTVRAGDNEIIPFSVTIIFTCCQLVQVCLSYIALVYAPAACPLSCAVD
jgi:hypothetical protein